MITGKIVGDAELIQRLNSMPEVIRGRLRTAIQRLTIQLQGNVKGDKLSGQVLQVRTGRLRRSITQQVTESGDTITGIVGTNVEYAHRLEYGFEGQETVREHIRKLKSGKIASVRSFVRNAKTPQRSFLRSALQEMKPTIIEEITAAMKKK